MAGLTAAVVVIGVITLFNVALTLGLARRIRPIQSSLGSNPFPPIGTQAGPFRVDAIGGGSICERDFAADSVIVAFLDAGCVPCMRLIDRLLASPPPEPLFAFVGEGGTESEAAELAHSLAAIARVAIVDTDGPVMRTFGIQAFPTLLRLQGGAVVAASERLERISVTNGADTGR